MIHLLVLSFYLSLQDTKPDLSGLSIPLTELRLSGWPKADPVQSLFGRRRPLYSDYQTRLRSAERVCGRLNA
jgi:hypothetical protein